MFDWGFTEFLLVAVVGLLVFGERLPEVARNAGQWVGKARRYIANVRSDFESELNTGELRELLGEQQKQIRELKGLVETAKDDFSSSMGEVTEELTDATDALNKTMKEQPLSAQSDEQLFAEDDLPVSKIDVDKANAALDTPEEAKPSRHD